MDLVLSQPVSSPSVSFNDKSSEPSTANTDQGKFDGRTVHVDSKNQSPNYIKTSEEVNGSNLNDGNCGSKCCFVAVSCCEIVTSFLAAM